MSLAAVLEPANSGQEHCDPKPSWWCDKELIQAAIHIPNSFPTATVCNYQFGDSLIQICANDPALLDSLDLIYGECSVRVSSADELPAIRCVISGAIHPQLIWIGFSAGAPGDLAGVALGLLHPPFSEPPYAIRNAQHRGWRLIGSADQPVVATCDHGLLFDKSQVPHDFLAEFVAAATLAEQTGVIALHAAAIKIGGSGVLLTGPSRAGKTTISAHLAARGHALLGDEISIVRLASRDLLPFRKSLSLRSGPRAPALSMALKYMTPRSDPSGPGKIGPYRIDELFPDSVASPVRLKAVFFLNGMTEHPSIEPFQLTMDHDKIFDYMAANDIASVSWGLTATRRAMRLFAVKQTMANVPCWMLTVGPPEETAQLIEHSVI